jgi:hypothetical protein
MKSISELVSSLNGYFGWNKAHRMCFVHALLGIIAVRTVNLQEIATAFPSKAKVTSRYRRLQRFFSGFEIDLVSIARWIFQLFLADTDKFYLIIDRTNWCWGKKKINVFMLSVAYEGLAIPLFWHLLDKGGSSNYAEQKALIEQFINVFGKEKIAGLLADREFANGKFFNWLTKNTIPFYIRIKEGSNVSVKGKFLWKAKKLFNDLNPKTMKPFDMAVGLFDDSTKVFLAGSRSERGELMIVATNQCPKNAIPIYLRRWEIESLFQSLKGRGFRFEETHITHPERIAKLMVLLAIGFAWAHKVGEWRALKKPITLKRFRRQKQQRPQYTFFRYGFDYIREAVLQLFCKAGQLRECIRLICLPPLTEAKL